MYVYIRSTPILSQKERRCLPSAVRAYIYVCVCTSIYFDFMYVCIYVYIYIYIYTYIYLCIYMYTYVYIYYTICNRKGRRCSQSAVRSYLYIYILFELIGFTEGRAQCFVPLLLYLLSYPPPFIFFCRHIWRTEGCARCVHLPRGVRLVRGRLERAEEGQHGPCGCESTAHALKRKHATLYRP